MGIEEKDKMGLKSVMQNILAVLALGLVMAGCAGTGSRDAGFALILSDVPLKEAGPNQVAPATTMLHRGDRVNVRRVMGDYAEVETMDHRRGYVPTGVLEDQ
ncbi:hypothetical protein EBX31_13455 [bacterium]|nr:hypothetical protein [bacterium]